MTPPITDNRLAELITNYDGSKRGQHSYDELSAQIRDILAILLAEQARREAERPVTPGHEPDCDCLKCMPMPLAERCPECKGIGAPWNNSSSVPCEACQLPAEPAELATVDVSYAVVSKAEPAADGLLTALRGLLALCEKQWGMLEETAKGGLATMSPPGVKFADLKFVHMSRAAISQYEQKERG